MFIDTHTHLFVEQFDLDRREVVERAIQAGVERLLLPNIDLDTIDVMNKLVSDFPSNCFPMMGLHPCSVEKDFHKQLSRIKIELETGKYIAVGEIGIDLYWSKELIQEQMEAFRIQVNFAKEFELPIVIHARESFDEIFQVLDEENDEKLRGVFHCFTGTLEQANKALSYGGFKLGIGGVLTYKKAGLDEVLKDVDVHNLILETDSPYLSPVPFRGKRNESSYVLYIAEKLADVKNMKLKEVEQITTKSALELFQLT